MWTPDAELSRTSALAGFQRWLAERAVVDTDDYRSLHAFSVERPDVFWSCLVDYLGVCFDTPGGRALAEDSMPGAVWFPGATLNYAKHALFPSVGGADDDVALIAVREDGFEDVVTFADLRDQVARARTAMQAMGVARGDRVVALAPNTVATAVAFLAAASLGAVWSCCSPDFGVRAVLDRFQQIEPKLLIAIDGYRYGGRSFDLASTLDTLRAGLPTLKSTVWIPYLGGSEPPAGAVTWSEFLAREGRLEFDPVPFDHPLWVLYSSGTTGLPKGIVHGQGGILLEHLKTLRLQFDVGPGDRLFWFTTTGWMMWNLIISGLACGAAVVLYDGSPGYPSASALWEMAQRHRVTVFGVSAAYLLNCHKTGQRPSDHFDLSSLRVIASTGSPLSDDGFDWVADAVCADVPVISTSGGTDVCSAFLGGSPTVPVWRGELSCAALGAAVAAFDSSGLPVIDEVGELVITRPMPSMPVAFWNDPDGSRLKAAYFEEFPGVWRHGDWVRITDRGSAVIYGRSDSTLNRGGVRLGTAELYAVLEANDDVRDSLVVDTSSLHREDGELLCFVVLLGSAQLDAVEPRLRSSVRDQLSPRHVPDRFIAVADIPKTLNGKKCEVPVRRILDGVDVDRAVSVSALANPEALAPFVAMAAARRS